MVTMFDSALTSAEKFASEVENPLFNSIVASAGQ